MQELKRWLDSFLDYLWYALETPWGLLRGIGIAVLFGLLGGYYMLAVAGILILRSIRRWQDDSLISS